jgi:hypothetical protein
MEKIMKRKPLFAIILTVALSLLLVVGVSAKTIYKYAVGNTIFNYEQNENKVITNIKDKDALLHCCGYMVVNETVTYINGNKTSDKAIKVSYNNYTGITE